MYFYKFCLFCLVSILCTCFYVGSSHTMKCAETNKQALLKLKQGFVHGSHTLFSWKGEDCCKWEGVSCNNLTGHVTMLDLQSLKLGGKIDSSVCELQNLSSLNLSFNKLEGKIPKCIGSLGQLIELNLTQNELVSSIPHTLANLSNLQTLDLSNNPFSSGPLPDFSLFSSLNTLHLGNTNIVGLLPQLLGHLPYLVYLNLSFNQLNGSLTSFEVSKLTSLQALVLSHNQLSGTLPSNIGQLSNLNKLFLSSNKLNGVISESHLSNLSSLDILRVAKNPLSFNLSSNWVPPFKLSELDASSCILGPEFPTWIKHFTFRYSLDISNSGISNSFPSWFWDLNLPSLNVSHNKISGTLPTSFASLKPVLGRVWDLSFNNLSGPLPLFPPFQIALFLSNNMFSGPLTSFCAIPLLELTYLDLSNNLLVGPLSDCSEKFQGLRVLSLANNKLQGRIPKSFGNLLQIESMHLNNNNFSGEMPSLARCRSLKFLDFGDNILKGTFPTWVGHNLTQLIVLRLRGNKFHGNIPINLCNLSFLQVLDLSTNKFSGEIPQCLSNIISLSNIKFPGKAIGYGTTVVVDPDIEFDMFLNSTTSRWEGGDFTDKVTLAWKGADREYEKNLRFMTIIDLSSNHLTGQIPQNITTLVALAALNLSRNNLTGFIPNDIGHMKMLESLDLSRNHLYGRMPTSFSNLSFLSYMDLSFNDLSGKIPVSTQLQTFDASTYFGNSGLCGPPLTNQCPWDVISPTGSNDKNDNNEEEDELLTFGFYVSLGIGFCVGFWGVCGTLVIKRSWRHAYFRFFNNMINWIYVTLVVSWARMKKRFQAQD